MISVQQNNILVLCILSQFGTQNVRTTVNLRFYYYLVLGPNYRNITFDIIWFIVYITKQLAMCHELIFAVFLHNSYIYRNIHSGAISMWFFFYFHYMYIFHWKQIFFTELLKSNPLTMSTNFEKTWINKFKISLAFLASYIFPIFWKNIKHTFGVWVYLISEVQIR